jgi:hypothetical protein
MANTSGELARLCEILAAHNVNLIVCGVAHGDRGTVAFIADDEHVAREALRGANVDYIERESLTVRMQNVPGAGAGALRTLADASVNIDLFVPVRIFDDQFYAVICPDDMTAARVALGELIVTA